jgi:hypothetical protein
MSVAKREACGRKEKFSRAMPARKYPDAWQRQHGLQYVQIVQNGWPRRPASNAKKISLFLAQCKTRSLFDHGLRAVIFRGSTIRPSNHHNSLAQP